MPSKMLITTSLKYSVSLAVNYQLSGGEVIIISLKSTISANNPTITTTSSPLFWSYLAF